MMSLSLPLGRLEVAQQLTRLLFFLSDQSICYNSELSWVAALVGSGEAVQKAENCTGEWGGGGP